MIIENSLVMAIKSFLHKNAHFFIVVVFLSVLTACDFSLVADVTPPPSLQQLSIEQPAIPPLEITEMGITTSTPPSPNTPFPGATSVSSSVSLSITGKIINHSTQGLPKDLLVTLHGFDQSVEVYTSQTTVDENGYFFFKDVQVNSAWVIFTSIDIRQITYHSEVVPPQPGTASLDLSIPVYGTTTDLSVLSIDRLHIFLEFVSPQILRVVQLYIISNNSPMLLTASAPGGPVIPYDLPKQASNLKFLDGFLGQRYQSTENGFADTTAVLPGEGSYQLMFAYDLPFDQKVDIIETMAIPVQNLNVMASKNDQYHAMRVKGDLLKTADEPEIGGNPYDNYRGESLSAGEKLQITVLASQPSLLNPTWPVFLTSSLNDIRLIIGAAFLGLTLVIFGIWLLAREKRTKRQNKPVLVKEEESFENPEALMDAIIALDDIYKSGDLPEKAYQERRARLKTRLDEMLKE